MTIALVDADLVAYRCSAAAQNQTASDAIRLTDDLINRLLNEVNATEYNCYLTGSDNYRYKYNPEYKANRKDTPKPQWLQHVREHLVVNWKASVEDGQEADDAMGIFQMANQNTIICSLDKDLLMIPGRHYSWEISGTSTTGLQWTRLAEFVEQDQIGSNRHFYYQLIMGDRADNIFGFDGLARQIIPKKLQPIIDKLNLLEDELDMFEFVRGLYNDDERLLMNGICLWIRRNENELWRFPT